MTAAPGITRFASPEAASRADTACTHCGLAVPRALIRAESTEQFCCSGCETAYSVIHSCGLDKYYELRQRVDSVAGPVKRSDRAFAEFDQDLFRSLYVRGGRNELCSTELMLQGVHCGACVWLVEKLPQLAPGVIDARVDVRRAILRLTWDDAQVNLSRVARVLDSIGYAPSPARDAHARNAAAKEDRRQLVRIAVAGACAGNVMLLAICLYAGLFEGIDAAHQQLFRWISMGITTVSLAWPGSVFFRSAWAAIKTRTAHLDVPITLALAVGATWSFYTTIKGSGEIYFDSLSALVFVLLCGRYVQHRQQRWAADALELLFALTPGFARRIEASGAVSEVPVEALAAGDSVEIRAGDTFPADGIVLRGAASVDESLLTGESQPKRVCPGTIVSAGSVNVSGDLAIQVSAAGENTRVARLMRLVESASRRRAPIVELANTLSAWFIGGMISLALLAGAVWMFIDPARAIDQAVALLVVTCPCALGLATPLTLTVALARASRTGVLIKGGDAVQRLSEARTIFLDKTGTLTTGRLSLVRWVGDDSIRPLVGALESRSTHIIAQALSRDLAPPSPASFDDFVIDHVEQVTGAGIRGVVNSRVIAIGSPAFVRSCCTSDAADWDVPTSITVEGLSPVAIAVDGRLAAWCGLGDQLRDDARGAINRLRELGFSLAILSGDDQRVVDQIAAHLNITDARGRLSPEDKLAAVRSASLSAPCVFVGDGVNDAAALAAASVGIAVHGGAEASLAVADVYLSRPGLSGVVDVFEGSRRTMRVITRNLYASGMYNIIAVVGTLMGMVTPLLAALIMPMSSITVLTLALVSWTFGPKALRRSFRSLGGAS